MHRHLLAGRHIIAGLTAKSWCQAAAETVEDPEGPAGADQWTPALPWEGGYGRPS